MLKQDLLNSLLASGEIVRIMIDGKSSKVIVPEHLKGNIFSLDIGLNMFSPIKDLLINENSISATLSFNRLPFKVNIPWNSIISLNVNDLVAVTFSANLQKTFNDLKIKSQKNTSQVSNSQVKKIEKKKVSVSYLQLVK